MNEQPRRVTFAGLLVCLIPGLIYGAFALLYHTHTPATPAAPQTPAVESPATSPDNVSPSKPAPRPDPATTNSGIKGHFA